MKISVSSRKYKNGILTSCQHIPEVVFRPSEDSLESQFATLTLGDVEVDLSVTIEPSDRKASSLPTTVQDLSPRCAGKEITVYLDNGSEIRGILTKLSVEGPFSKGFTTSIMLDVDDQVIALSDLDPETRINVG